MRYFAVMFMLFVSSAAYAQTPPAIPTAQEVIERTLGNLFITNQNLTERLQRLQASTDLINADLVKARDRIKELEANQEKK